MTKLRALWGATHPGPTLVVTTLALALALAVGLEPIRMLLLVVAVFFGQVSVGLSNDAVDAARDAAVGRADKPVARGRAGSALAVLGGASVAVAIAIALSAPLGSGMLAAHALALAAAWAYNAGLKSTAASILPFLFSFGLFPSLATLARPEPSLAPVWATIAGAALGAAVHLTNVLPDLEDDLVTGVRGLPHRLGARVSAVLAVAGLLAGAAAVLFGPAVTARTGIPPLAWAFASVVAVVAVATGVRALVRPPDRTVFRFVMLTALLLAAQLVATGDALTS